MNNKKFFFVFLWLFLLLSCGIKAQVVVERSSEIVTIGGKEYYMHHVKQGETLYSISQAYQVTVEEIERLNPEVADGFEGRTGYRHPRRLWASSLRIDGKGD